MATTISFDLNTAFDNWRENLRRSTHFRAENIDELEAHLRDSVAVLQSSGLRDDEAFLIGMRRVGTSEMLEGQFAAENGGQTWPDVLRRFSHRNKARFLHLLILTYFTLGCWLLRGCITVGGMIMPAAARASRISGSNYQGPPEFTRFCIGLAPYWYILPIFAALYCALAWLRKPGVKSSAFAFFSFATALLFLLLIPIVIASQLPVIAFLNSLPPKTFQAP